MVFDKEGWSLSLFVVGDLHEPVYSMYLVLASITGRVEVDVDVVDLIKFVAIDISKIICFSFFSLAVILESLAQLPTLGVQDLHS